MTSMNAKENKPLLPAYLVVGEDALKRAAVIKRLRARLEQCGDLAFNSDDIDAEAVEDDVIVSSCNTVPFASDYRLVYVRNAEKLRKQESDALVAYLKSPNPSTVLCLEAEKLAKNSRLYKAIAALDKNAVIECVPLKKYELPKTVRSMAVSHGVTFTEGAAKLLVDLVGENTVHLDAEIRKIALAHRGSDAVNEAEVMSITARTAEVKPWEFVDAFAARDLPKCLLYLGRMSSMTPHALIAMCVNRLRELVCAKAVARRGSATTAQLSAALSAAGGRKMQDWQLKNHFRWAACFSVVELRRAIISARDAERAMKSGADPHEAFLDWMIGVLRR